MELKEYQQDVINHLSEFIEELEQTNQIDKAVLPLINRTPIKVYVT